MKKNIPAPNRTAFTLMDLLVAIGVLVLLLGLLIPAIFAARESGRYKQCTSNIRMLAESVHSFVESNGILPSAAQSYNLAVNVQKKYSGRDGWGTEEQPIYRSRGRLSFLCDLLPHFEQVSLYEVIVQGVDSDTALIGPWCFEVNSTPTVWTAKIASLLCPSSGASFDETEGGGTSYHCNRGDMWIAWHGTESRGPFALGSQDTFGFEGIPDGLSNTILLSEVVISPNMAGQHYGRIKGGVATSVPKRQVAGPPQPCLDRAGSHGMLKGTPETDYAKLNGSQSIGRRWGDAHSIYTQFHTLLPPNAPNCTGSPGTKNGANEHYVLVTASSHHLGGVNVAFADGSVRFISDSIHVTNLDRLPPGQPAGSEHQYTGPSIWGVWASLGTRNGGELVALP